MEYNRSPIKGEVMDEVVEVEEVEPKSKFIDDIAKGAITMVIGTILTRVVEGGYDKLVISRRNKVHIPETES